MAGVVGQFGYDVATQLLTYGGQFLDAELAQVGRTVDVLEITERFVLFHAFALTNNASPYTLWRKGA